MEETRASRPNRQYKLLPYDPAWKAQFAAVAEKLKPIFADNLITVEHIGSTSVSGMVAKPQIDILVIVHNLGKVKDIYDQMRAAGYASKGDFVGNNEEYFTLDDAQGTRLVSIHTMQADNPEAKMYLNFRDYLRTHEDARNQYIARKLELNAKFSNEDYNSYDAGKNELIAELRQKASEWAKNK